MLAGSLAVLPCSAQKTEMTYEDYEIAIADAQQREKTAKEQIATEQASIEELRRQITEIEGQLAALINERNSILGITDQDILNALSEIAAIRDGLKLLQGLSGDELAPRLNELSVYENRIKALKAKNVSRLFRIAEQITQLESIVTQLRSILPSKAFNYTVQLVPGNRESLYSIASKEEVFGDPAKWPLLYRGNKETIDRAYDRYTRNTDDPKFSKAQDLIFPGQVLEIPR